jgi:hypothetical protein
MHTPGVAVPLLRLEEDFASKVAVHISLTLLQNMAIPVIQPIWKNIFFWISGPSMPNRTHNHALIQSYVIHLGHGVTIIIVATCIWLM